MRGVQDDTAPARLRLVAISLSMAFGLVVGSCSPRRPAGEQTVPGTIPSSVRMPDGKQWTTENLNIHTDSSWCYADDELNCRRYGRLYTWESAQRGCQSLGGGWRLPTDDEWRQLARHHGGVSGDPGDAGKSAYRALMSGGGSGFNALLGGGRELDGGGYARVEAHGFYWTASESSSANAVFYNFARGGLALHRQSEGEKPRAFSVRCVRE